jgi:pimeloyl-ACP methyl ester carboxylesterase
MDLGRFGIRTCGAGLFLTLSVSLFMAVDDPGVRATARAATGDDDQPVESQFGRPVRKGEQTDSRSRTTHADAAVARRGVDRAAVGVAGDPPGVSTKSDRAVASPPFDDRLRQEPGGLCWRRPYERGKIPVVLIHGLWGNPRQWDRMVDALEADPTLGGRFQFWTFRYATGDPIPFSAHLLRQALRRARLEFDPGGADAAFDRMVLVGHSLGGILAKMMVQASGSRLWQTVGDFPSDRIVGPPEDCQLIRQAFCYEPLPEVRRVVFIATPHRGSPIVRGLFLSLGTRLCRGPSRFREACEALLTRNGPDVFALGFRGELPTSVGELASEHPLLVALCDLGIDPSVRSHSIIADLRDPPGPGATDGIVPYSSSHLECAASELLFHGKHACLDDPEVIREARRILVEHAGINTTPGTDRGDLARDGLGTGRVN